MNLLTSKKGRYFLFGTLYFSEGAPIGFIWWALPAFLRNSGIPVENITSLIAVLVFPWIFKFVWAPLVDSLRSEKHGFRIWIASAQTLMAASLFPLIFFDPIENFSIWAILLFIHSMSAATQDVAIDALVINNVDESERGIVNGFMNTGMLAGRSLFGGGTLIIVSSLGLDFTITALSFFIVIIMSLLLFVKEPDYKYHSKDKFKKFAGSFVKNFSKSRTWLAIGFALTAAAAFEVVGALAGPFLTDRNVSQKSIGLFFGLPVVIAMVSGGLIGGRLSDIIERKKAVALFLTGFVIVICLLAVYDMFAEDHGSEIYFFLLTAMYFFTGLFTASSYALFMDLTDPQLSGTQFSTYMSATNACESWTVFAAGLIIAGHGYPPAFLVMCAVSLTGIIFLSQVKIGTSDT